MATAPHFRHHEYYGFDNTFWPHFSSFFCALFVLHSTFIVWCIFEVKYT